MDFKPTPLIKEFLASKGFSEKAEIELAGTAGSKRNYYRISENLISFVILQSPKDDLDFSKFLRLTQFYRLLNFPVPKVYCIDDVNLQVLLEDLGTNRLYDIYVKEKKNCMTYYTQTIDTLIDLQTRCNQSHDECPDILSRIFNQDQLLWETSYFLDEYLIGYKKMKFSSEVEFEIKTNFSQLAKNVSQQPKSIMHRDFQSQNLMITNEKIRVIDYQGSRLGSVYYDIASLLLDPYCMLSEQDIKSLLQYYHSKSPFSSSFQNTEYSFYLAGAQRIMQALGAFCFLSQKKSLIEFEKFIEPGKKRLIQILEKAEFKDILNILD